MAQSNGNLASDGRWTYEWDADGARQRGDGAPKACPKGAKNRAPSGRGLAQNRLRAMQTRPDVAAMFPALKQRIEFSYDHQGRRIRKSVKNWDSSTTQWETTKDLRFVYDGWNLIEERDSLNGGAVIRKHVWGPDLSGTMQGAGGVGGLLWTTTPTQTFAASSDANGNIVAWINTATLAVASRADYSPFGEPVVRTGIAQNLPFGFSTKYEDSETGLLYYGFRYYNPSTGRFLNRDPIEELGGLNLHAFVGNDPVNRVDYLGLFYLNFRKGGFRTPIPDQISMRFFSSYLPDGTPWTSKEMSDVSTAEAEAINSMGPLLAAIDRFIEEIPELYCATHGRNVLLFEAKYARETTLMALDAMLSSENLNVRKAIGPGSAFVPPTDNLYVTGDFFRSGPLRRAATFFHETTHIISRTDDYNRLQDVGGWHRVSDLYSDLLLFYARWEYAGVRAAFERNNGNYINHVLLLNRRVSDLIYRKDGIALGR